MTGVDIVLPPVGELRPDYLHQQGRTYGSDPTFLYLNTGSPKLASAAVRLAAGDYSWKNFSEAPFCVCWPIPVVVATPAFLDLVQSLEPLFAVVATGLRVDTSNVPVRASVDEEDELFHVPTGAELGVQILSPKAQQARQQIADELAVLQDWAKVEIHDAVLTADQERDLIERIAPEDTIYPELADLAETVRAAATPTTPGNYVVIPGMIARLRELQNGVRARELAKLEAIAKTARTATEDRDRLLCKAASWKDTSGETSQRALATRAGLSGRGVGKILARGRVEEAGVAPDVSDLVDPELEHLSTDAVELHLDRSTPEQRYRWTSCEHPGAMVVACSDGDQADDGVSNGIGLRELNDVGQDLDDMRIDNAVGICGACSAPVVTVRMWNTTATWRSPWTLLHRDGDP
jgi:hypothetical protein